VPGMPCRFLLQRHTHHRPNAVSGGLLLPRGLQHVPRMPCGFVLPDAERVAAQLHGGLLLQRQHVCSDAVPRRLLLPAGLEQQHWLPGGHVFERAGCHGLIDVPGVSTWVLLRRQHLDPNRMQRGLLLSCRQHRADGVPGQLLLPDGRERARELHSWLLLLRQQRQLGHGVRRWQLLPRCLVDLVCVPGRHVLDRDRGRRRVVLPGVSCGLLLQRGNGQSDHLPFGQLLSTGHRVCDWLPCRLLLSPGLACADCVPARLLLRLRCRTPDRVPDWVLLPRRLVHILHEPRWHVLAWPGAV
jgi:hypothetical protein